MKALGYIRVSTEDQAQEGVSLAAQRERIVAYCSMAGLELVELHADNGISAGKPLHTRNGGQRLLAALEAGEAEHVIALKLDRLFRDTVDCLQTVQEWDRCGVSLHLIDMGGQTLNTGSAMGRFFLTMAAGFAEMERNLTGERTTAALAWKKAQGQKYAPTPYGYREAEGKLLPNDEELAVVARIKNLRGEGVSYHKIADALNLEGVPSKRGGKWYASTVHYIDRNDLYAEEVA